MNRWLENLLEKMTKWFFVNALILKLDIISLLIDGLFYKALSEDPQAILSRADANALKISVLVFVVLVCIIQLINISSSFSIYIYLIRDSYENGRKKMDWPLIISMLVAWIDFAQIAIALTTAFRTHQLIGRVQITKAVFGLIKAYLQIPALVILYYDGKYCPRVFDVHHEEENLVDTSKARWSSHLIITLVGFVFNFVCSFALLVRVFMLFVTKTL